MHVDMDAFFAAVEERYNPQFAGLPIVVGADPKDGRGRGVVSTANYAARKYGIKSAVPISQAWRLAEAAQKRGEPKTIFLTGNFLIYGQVSERIMGILAAHADTFEVASIDEAYLDISSRGDFDAAVAIGKDLKEEIFRKEGLSASVGIGPNKLIAKIASDFQKPNGLTLIRPENVQAFLDPLSIRVIPGIGPKGEMLLKQKGIGTVAQLRAVSPENITEWFGKWGTDLFLKAQGISTSPVGNDGEAKSVGEQETFEKDTLAAGFILERLQALSDTVFRRFSRDGLHSFGRVVVTVRFSDFLTKTRSHTLKQPLETRRALHGEALRLLLPFLDRRENPQRKMIRLIGVRVEKIG